MRRKNCEMVPAQPFADLLNARVAYWERELAGGVLPGDDGPTVRVARQFGWVHNKEDADTGVRRLYRHRHRVMESAKGKSRGSKGTRTVYLTDEFRRDIVEDALHHAGIPFAELYPEIAEAEEVELEPAKWCPNCQEERTPINGICAFCNWRIGPATGQVLRGRFIRKRDRVSQDVAA